MKAMNSRYRQRGALMVVALIFLLIVSMLAMSTVDTTGLEMRMASNNRDQQMAFEAAEYTLSFVETQIAEMGGFSDDSLANNNCGALCFTDDCEGGYCFNGEDPLDWANCEVDASADEFWEDPDIWSDSDYHLTLDVPGSDVDTKYIVEFRCYTARDASQPMDLTNNARVYRITAFATGEGGRGRVMLRSTMKEM